MKKITILFVLFVTVIGYSQNNSSQGVISTTIPTSALGTQEVFRFKPGLVTQLQQGTTSFGFGATDRWLSLGELTTQPSGQTLHGLRLQNNGNGLVMGYSSQEFNPFIQYIGTRGLDIKCANSFTSTDSKVVAAFKQNGSTDFGFSDPLSFRPPVYQVGILSRFLRGLYVRRGDNTINATDFIAGDFGGQIIATTATFTSDAQFKKDVKKESSSLEIVNSLNPVSYLFERNNKFGFSFSDKLQHGFIAQELEKILPELVQNNNEDGIGTYKSVNYNGLIAILTKSVQELSQEVEVLKAQLEESKTYVVSKDSFSKNEIEKIKENGYYLGQNTPNPFEIATTIEYSFPQNEKNVVLMVFNLNGEKLKEYNLQDFKGSVTISANEFKPGLYLYSLISNNSEVITKKMLVK